MPKLGGVVLYGSFITAVLVAQLLPVPRMDPYEVIRLTGLVVGATIIFKIAQSALGEGLLRKAGPRAAKIAEGIQADAFNYLLFLRLVPAFPFFLVNLAAALVAMPLWTFVAANFTLQEPIVEIVFSVVKPSVGR